MFTIPVTLFTVNVGSLTAYRPTSGTLTNVTSTVTSSSVANAYDTTGTAINTMTCSTLVASSGTARAGYVIYSGFGSTTVSGTLYVNLNFYSESATSQDTTNQVTTDPTVYYSTDGTNYTSLYDYSDSGFAVGGSSSWSGQQTVSIALSNVNLANLKVRVNVSAGKMGTTTANTAVAGCEADIYDILFLA